MPDRTNVHRIGLVANNLLNRANLRGNWGLFASHWLERTSGRRSKKYSPTKVSELDSAGPFRYILHRAAFETSAL